MTYSNTWFAKHPMVMRSSIGNERMQWLHHYVEVVTGRLQPIHKTNHDGSIDILGAEVLRLSSGLSYGSREREKIQQSLADHADMLLKAGAKIVKQTRNTLVARYGNETGYWTITTLTAKSFYRNLNQK